MPTPFKVWLKLIQTLRVILLTERQKEKLVKVPPMRQITDTYN